MQRSPIQFVDLPNEILLLILKKLNNVSTLYSLMGINKQLDKVLHDPFFTSQLSLYVSFSDYVIKPFSNEKLDRFCLQILPDIHNNIKRLNLEASSIERILLSINYPKLRKLGLYNLKEELAQHLFTDENALTDLFKNQITTLVIDFFRASERQELNLRPVGATHYYLSFDMSSPVFFSSTLRTLYLKLKTFIDCIYLLNGRFNQLQTFCAHIATDDYSAVKITNKEKLPRLNTFLLVCEREIHFYKGLVLPLLRRMTNLKTLGLYLRIGRIGRFIDGDELKKNILDYMPQLNKFEFKIRSAMYLYSENFRFKSSTDIQKTFGNFQNQVISYVDFFPYNDLFECGLFNHVLYVNLYHDVPFEYNFFLRIGQSFPFMKKLSIRNTCPQRNKQFNEDLPIIEYPHLNDLNIIHAHGDYIKLFLFDRNVSLPNNFTLHIDYLELEGMITKLTSDVIQVNCSKVRRMHLWHWDRSSILPEWFNAYFSDIELFIG